MVCKKCSAALSPGFCRINRQAQKAFAVNAVLRQFFLNKMPQKNRLTSGLRYKDNPKYRQVSWVIISYQSTGFIVGNISVCFITSHNPSYGV